MTTLANHPDRTREGPDTPNLAAAFRATVARAPDAACVVDGDVTLTRGEVLAWGERLGATLLSSGCEPGQVVAILVPRSWAAPCAMLAARAADMVFLPLDASAPAARTRAILEAARPRAVVTFAAGARDGLPTPERTADVAPPHPELEALTVSLLPGARTLPPDVGHVVFTSGSTGAPKGVVLRDGPLVRTCAQQRDWCGNDGAPVLWALNPAFDASLSDLFRALLAASPLVVIRSPVTRVRELGAAMRRHGIGHADLPPSLLRVLPTEGVALRSLVFGGEACDPAMVLRWSAACPTVLQAYGPTEAAVCAMMAAAHPGWVPNELGRPLDHQVVTIRDARATHHRLLPRHPEARPSSGAAFNLTDAHSPGEVPHRIDGELVLWGPAVAVGYLDGDDRDRFVGEGRTRAHLTGDVVRWEGGTTTWLGRTDRQVKRNGRMVCPEEVEALVTAATGAPCACLPSGRDLVLLAAGDVPDGVRTLVARTLGDAFRPTRVVRVPDWPLNANGKTDLAVLRGMAAP